MLARATAISMLVGLAAAAPASAQSPPFAPWDGTNPFNCVEQDVGTGTEYPDPGADPFCVKFDKTNQNITDFGIAEFAAQEPSRVAAAGTKCFYFQNDHWTGSIQQGTEPEAPAEDVPATEAPATEAPATEARAAEVAEPAATDTPAAESPATATLVEADPEAPSAADATPAVGGEKA